MNRILVSILFLIVGLYVDAADLPGQDDSELLIFRRIELSCPWLKSGNASGLSQISGPLPSEIKIDYGQSSGNYHSVFNGRSNRAFGFSSKGYRRFNNTVIFGSFNYSNSSEKELNYNNSNDALMNYPYLFADTIGGDTYERELFRFSAKISARLNNVIDWGIGVNYKAGVASQNRDPRPENKISQVEILPGLLYKRAGLKFGANFLYEYYNEDIDVITVNKNVQSTLFQMHGLGVFTYHSSSSFFRLYQQNKYGGGLQVEYKSSRMSNFINSDFFYSLQTVDDGRKGSRATWSTVKNDARLDGVNWNLEDILEFKRGKKVNQFDLKMSTTSKIGSEYIQILDNMGDAELEHWITLGREMKFYIMQFQASLNYHLLQNDESYRLKSLFNAGISYHTNTEKYYLPNQSQKYSNLLAESSFLKLFYLPNGELTAGMKLRYGLNLEATQRLERTNFMIQKVYLPEFNYLTCSYISPGVSLAYQVPFKNKSGKYFIKSDFDWVHANNGMDRTWLSIATGITF